MVRYPLPLILFFFSRISAANASQISDGAAAVLLMSGKKMRELGLKPKARIVSTAVSGSDPILMLTGNHSN